mmetsp:Transcript_10558/g.31772  ORF Transcript_10558/g.31772 Transcript_10558/m.31772 type:complete len:276 (+) Transcript_10558:1635-2462(+)
MAPVPTSRPSCCRWLCRSSRSGRPTPPPSPKLPLEDPATALPELPPLDELACTEDVERFLAERAPCPEVRLPPCRVALPGFLVVRVGGTLGCCGLASGAITERGLPVPPGPVGGALAGPSAEEAAECWLGCEAPALRMRASRCSRSLLLPRPTAASSSAADTPEVVRPMALVPGLTEVEVRSRALSRVGSLCASADAFRRSKMSLAEGLSDTLEAEQATMRSHTSWGHCSGTRGGGSFPRVCGVSDSTISCSSTPKEYTSQARVGTSASRTSGAA